MLLAALIAATLTAAPAWAHRPGVVTVPRYQQALHHVLRLPRPGGYGGDYHAYGNHPRGQRWLATLRSRAKGPNTRRIMRRLTAKRLTRWRFARYLDRITAYGEWVIPSYVVQCESGFNYSPDYGITGYGAYALISWADYGGNQYASSPSAAPAWAQHIVAYRMYRDRGLQPWECA